MRSGYEKQVATWFRDHGIAFNYETALLNYYVLVRKGKCGDCDSRNVLRQGLYTADFSFPKFKFFVETKGRFTSKDRTKMLAVQQEGQDIRLVFQRDNKLRKKSSTRYSQWADRYGFKYAVGMPDPKWFSRGRKV